MRRVVVDAVLRNKLQNLVQPLELCDESGKVLARVYPVPDPAESNLEPKIGPEEIRRRMQSDEKRYTTTEVLAHLEQR
jgi:hypothetical protein